MTNERPFYLPFPNIPWDRNYEETPKTNDFPTASTTTLLDPLEKEILRRRRLLQAVENANLSLPPRWTGTTELTKVYEVISDYLTADRSRKRKQAKKRINMLFESELDVALLEKFFQAQSKPPSQLTEIRTRLEEMTKPPRDFRVFGIFQPHRIETIDEGEKLKQQITTIGRQLFEKNDDNIFFLEDSHGDFFENPDFYDAFNAYGLVRKAHSFVYQKNKTKFPKGFTQLSKKEREIFDQLVSVDEQIWDTVVKNPQSGPEGVYMWLQFEAIDELIKEGFPIRILWENGKMSKHWIRQEDTTPENWEESMMHNLSLLAERQAGKSDEGIANQLINLEKNKAKSKRTNVIMVFGSNHIASLDYLPQRLRSVTVHYFKY